MFLIYCICICLPTLYCRYVGVGLGSAGEGCVQEHHGKQGRDERLQGRQVGVQLVLIQTVFSLLGGKTEQG